jgi:hypothetical protein
MPMPSPLIVTGNDPVHLDGHLDSSNALQVKHSTNSLANYDQALDAQNDDLRSPSETIRVELGDFANGGANWQLTASHVVNQNTVNWTRNATLAYCDFGAMTDFLEVTVVATSNASPPATKTRTVYIKTRPLDGMPDGS